MTPAAGLKAEMVLALQLSTRHRSVRLAGVLALVGVALARGGGGQAPMLLLAASVLGATAAARSLAPGAAWQLARRAAAPPIMVAIGRLGGVVLLLALALALGAAVGGWPTEAPVLEAAAVALVGGVAIAALVLALTPVAGASGAAGLGILAGLFGQVPPSVVGDVLAGWPAARSVAVLVWNAAPLGWRVERWRADGETADAGVLLVWIVLGLAAAAWALLPPRGTRGVPQ